ncbi:MAG: TRAP transporter small permease subunit [Stappiaceae bacterium]
MKKLLNWLEARADNVAVGLLAAMFLAFVLQIVSRYVLNSPLGWTLEACLISWVWVVFWGSAFLVNDQEHVRFDILYSSASTRVRKIFALIAAIAIAGAFLTSLPATYDFISFMQIEKSSVLGIRLDYVFSVYLIFAIAIIVRYGARIVAIFTGKFGEPERRL